MGNNPVAVRSIMKPMPNQPASARRLLHALLVLALLAPAPSGLAAPLAAPEPAAMDDMPCHDAEPAAAQLAADDCCTTDDGCMMLCAALVSAGAVPSAAIATLAPLSTSYSHAIAPRAPPRLAAAPPLRPPSR